MVRRSATFVQESFPSRESLSNRELSVERIHRQRGPAVVGEQGLMRPERTEMEPVTRRQLDQQGRGDSSSVLGSLGVDLRSDRRFYRLEAEGTYVVEFAENVVVPPDSVGFVSPGEHLCKAGVLLETSLVEPGETSIGATVSVVEGFALLAAGATIAEFVVLPTADSRDH